MNNKKRLNIKTDGNHLFINVGKIRRRFIMKLDKAKSRDKKRDKKKHGMRVSGKSIFTIVEAQVKRAEKDKPVSGGP